MFRTFLKVFCPWRWAIDSLYLSFVNSRPNILYSILCRERESGLHSFRNHIVDLRLRPPSPSHLRPPSQKASNTVSSYKWHYLQHSKNRLKICQLRLDDIHRVTDPRIPRSNSTPSRSSTNLQLSTQARKNGSLHGCTSLTSAPAILFLCD
jgi:hypothetical protein